VCHSSSISIKDLQKPARRRVSHPTKWGRRSNHLPSREPPSKLVLLGQGFFATSRNIHSTKRRLGGARKSRFLASLVMTILGSEPSSFPDRAPRSA
jgi:hypothetical protein